MKVLMFGWEFPPYISGGLGTACYGLTQHMARRGARITFVLPMLRERAQKSHVKLMGAVEVAEALPKAAIKEASLVREREEENMRFLRVSSALRPYLTEQRYVEELARLERERVRALGGKPEGRDVSDSVIQISGEYGRNLVEEVHRYATVGRRLAIVEDFDIIHAHDWMTFPAAIAAKQASGKPLVIHVHATEFDRSGDHPNWEIYHLEKWGMEAADRIIAVSGRTRDLIVSRYFIAPAKVAVVHNAVIKEKTVERKQVVRGVKEKIVLFLGRVTLQKGPDYFVEAAARVARKIKNVRFVMAGTGDMLPRMIERMAQHRLLDRFHFTGFLRGKKLEEMYAMSDLYVMPSVSEPFGITPFEAMKYGVPVIVSKQAGITEVLPHLIKVDFWDVEALARSILDVLTDPEYSEGLVETNTRELEKVDWDNSAAKVLDIYGGLLP